MSNAEAESGSCSPFLVSYMHVVEFEMAPSLRLLQIALSVFINHSQQTDVTAPMVFVWGKNTVMTWVWWLVSQ